MRLRWLLAAAMVTAGCGSSQVPPPSPACLESPAAVLAALDRDPVALADGTTLVQCVQRARSDGELQSVGVAFSRAAERLRSRLRQPNAIGAARQLGHLVGVTRRGAATTNGVLLELVRRIESTAGRALGDAGAQEQRAFDAGLRASEAASG